MRLGTGVESWIGIALVFCLACTHHPPRVSNAPPAYGESPYQQIVGVLRIRGQEACVEHGGKLTRLIQASPVTAMSYEALLKQTARALADLDGQQVSITGIVQGDTMWS